MSFTKKFNKEIRDMTKLEALTFVERCMSNNEFPSDQLGVYRFYVAENFEDYELAREIEREYHSAYPDQFRLRFMSAGVAIALKNYEEAEDHLLKLIDYEEKTRKYFSIDNALLFLAHVYEQQGLTVLMKKSLDRIKDRSTRTWGVGKVPDLTLEDFSN